MENITQTTQFEIYRDGQLDKLYHYKQVALRMFSGLGQVAYKGLEVTLDAGDSLVEAFNAI